MNPQIEKLNAKIEKLLQQKQQIEEACVQAFFQIVSDAVKRGIDIQILAGLLLDVREIMKAAPEKREAWQIAGQKFLSKTKYRGPPFAKDQPTSGAI